MAGTFRLRVASTDFLYFEYPQKGRDEAVPSHTKIGFAVCTEKWHLASTSAIESKLPDASVWTSFFCSSEWDLEMKCDRDILSWQSRPCWDSHAFTPVAGENKCIFHEEMFGMMFSRVWGLNTIRCDHCSWEFVSSLHSQASLSVGMETWEGASEGFHLTASLK